MRYKKNYMDISCFEIVESVSNESGHYSVLFPLITGAWTSPSGAHVL